MTCTFDNTQSANNCVSWPNYYQTTWCGYPVYYCIDKTAEAIEILKELQAEKLIKVESVPRFIALVEKIAAKL